MHTHDTMQGSSAPSARVRVWSGAGIQIRAPVAPEAIQDVSDAKRESSQNDDDKRRGWTQLDDLPRSG